MLHVHRAERADALVAALGALLEQPPPDPFAGEVVAVPTRGVERWLAQQLSGRLGATPGRADGVCANVGFPSPRRLAADAVAAASGIDPATDPWLAERIVWPLLEVVEASLGEPWLALLATHLGAGAGAADATRGARRMSTVRHVAELFDRYALHRPQMLLAWADGRDAGASARELPADARWQPELWRRLRAHLDGADDPASRLRDACRRLRDEPALADLPPRLSLFGLTRLAPATLHTLGALAAQRDVHVFALHPSPALWARVAAAASAVPAPARARGRAAGDAAPGLRRDDDATAHLPSNRLLASWGRDARELQLVLGALADASVGHHHASDAPTTTLLARIQADVRADRPPPGAPLPGEDDARPPLAPGDRSLQVHACHGHSRQVEVLRDAILHILAEDPTLEPRDIVVMCPDIETFAPLIQATFGAGRVAAEDERDREDEDLERPPDLRVRIADRSLRQTNPILAVVSALLELAGGRVSASQVLDLADRRPVRRRFGLDDDDLSRIEDWVGESGIHWGLDAAHRRSFKLGALDAGTWRAGLDRLLLGVTMTEAGGRLVGGVLALDDVDSGAIELAGRLAELVDRLGATLDELSVAQPIASWARSIAAGADALTATTPSEGWQRAELQRLLDDVVCAATGAGTVNATPLEPAEVRALLAERLEGRPTRASFRTGHLTFCTLVPMRSVPHRVICLLGLDDGAFPRRTARDGDDLILDDPCVGDRDLRAEDRQLLLDALLAATDRLVVTYTGNDERTNIERPAAVPVGELLDAIDATVRAADGRRAREHVVVRHPLQPFDPRNFVTTATPAPPSTPTQTSTATPSATPTQTPTPTATAAGEPWSFDRVTLDGALALTGPRGGQPPFLARRLPPLDARIVELDDLVRFVSHPVRAFLAQRLGIRGGVFSDEIRDELPVELDHLERWGVGERLLGARLAGMAIADAGAIEVARGSLPPGRLAVPVLASVSPVVDQILDAVRALGGEHADPQAIDVDLDLGDGRRLSGVVAGIGGDVLHAVSYSRVRPSTRLAAWVRLLALVATHPQRPWHALTIGRAQPGAGEHAAVTVARIGPLAATARERSAIARAQLAGIVDLHDRGMREPLPLACLSGAAYARAAAAGKDAREAARRQWESGFRFAGEDRQREHEIAFGGVLAFDELLASPPREDERGDGWDERETTRFGRCARRLWDGLATYERVTER